MRAPIRAPAPTLTNGPTEASGATVAVGATLASAWMPGVLAGRGASSSTARANARYGFAGAEHRARRRFRALAEDHR